MQLDFLKKLVSPPLQSDETVLGTFRTLKATVEKASLYFKGGNLPQSQRYTEQAFVVMMRLMHLMHLDLEQVIERIQHQYEATANPVPSAMLGGDRVILVFGDHAELRVDGELRGTFPLYHPEDMRELEQMAILFDCRMEHADHLQLDIFGAIESA